MVLPPGIPSVSNGTSAPLASALLAPSGAATPSMTPVPNFSGWRETAFFNPVGQKRRHRRAGAGQRADEKSDNRAVQKSKAAIFEILQRRQKVSQPVRKLEQLGASLGFQVDQHFADGENADRGGDKIDAAKKLRLAESESRFAGEKIGADGRDPQTDEHRQKRFDHRISRQENHHGEAQNHQGEIFRRSEAQREARQRRRDQHQSQHADGARNK